jgi:Protein of unknown function (DUF2778)
MHAIPNDQHPHHQFGVDRGTANSAVERLQLRSHTLEVEELIDAPEQVVAGHVIIKTEIVSRLEAHSGLGDRLDDPRYVNERMRGATPPNVYELQPREQLFHGVQALRLIPVGGGDLHGRTGLLAHTYMLGPKGDSNGCVSFKNYNTFLQAFQNGEIKRLAVVARLN